MTVGNKISFVKTYLRDELKFSDNSRILHRYFTLSNFTVNEIGIFNNRYQIPYDNCDKLL